MRDDTNATLAFQRDANTKTFEDKHGQTLAQRIYRLCNVPNTHTQY